MPGEQPTTERPSTSTAVPAGLRVLVTAGAGGIGLAIAERLLRSRARVHICDIDAAALERFRERHPAAAASFADVADESQVARVFAELQAGLGGLDVLINNAGIAGPTAPVERIDPADWDRTVAVDLSGPFYCARRAVPLLKAAGGGCIVNIASNAAFFGFPLRAPYAACKWALIGLTKTLAMELGPYGIRVNAICPGSVAGTRIETVIEREAAARGISAEQVRASYLEQSSLRRFVEAAEIAELVAFLCSNAGRSISGQAIGIDGHTETLSQH